MRDRRYAWIAVPCNLVEVFLLPDVSAASFDGAVWTEMQAHLLPLIEMIEILIGNLERVAFCHRADRAVGEGGCRIWKCPIKYHPAKTAATTAIEPANLRRLAK